MTAIVARSPLNPLSMSGAQTNGNKRKSTRLAFTEEDAPPTKRTKPDVATKGAVAHSLNAGKKTNASSAASTRTRATKKAYDEHDDDFSFTRTRSTRTRSKLQQSSDALPPQSQSQPEPKAAVDDAPAEPPATEARQKRKPRKTLPVSPEPDRTQHHLVRRRSKRLSADNREPETTRPEAPVEPARPHSESAHGPIATPKKAALQQQHEESPQIQPGQEEQGLHVDKKRRLTKILLPTSDTPIIRRNKEMRKTSAENSRRSSSGMRGRRASSLIDTGTSHESDLNIEVAPLFDSLQEGGPARVVQHDSPLDGVKGTLLFEVQADQDVCVETAVPHSEVETQELYKHISQDLVEPKRMRQLLVWCGNRALLQKPGAQLEPAETAAIHAARVIQEELLNEFGSKGELSSWFDREDIAPAVLVKKPNPRNIQNAEKLQQLEAELARLQEEKRSWDDLISSSNSAPSSQAENNNSLHIEPTSIDASLLDPSQSDILNILLSNLSTLDQSTNPRLPKTDPDSHTHSSTSPSSSIPQTQQSSSSSSSTDLVATAHDRITSISRTLEFKLDQFADSTHRMAQYRLVADRVADSVLAAGAQRLEERDRLLRGSTATAGGSGGAGKSGDGGKEPVDPIDTLRSLSRVLHSQRE